MPLSWRKALNRSMATTLLTHSRMMTVRPTRARSTLAKSIDAMTEDSKKYAGNASADETTDTATSDSLDLVSAAANEQVRVFCANTSQNKTRTSAQISCHDCLALVNVLMIRQDSM
jgi:hypothetical protein